MDTIDNLFSARAKSGSGLMNRSRELVSRRFCHSWRMVRYLSYLVCCVEMSIVAAFVCAILAG